MAKVIQIIRIDAHGRLIVKVKKMKAPRPVARRVMVPGGVA